MKIVVFDFDKTLTVEHIGHWHSHSNMHQGFGGSQRLSMLDSMLSALQASGVTLAIVSYNDKRVILRALKICELHHFFQTELVFGSEVFADGEKWSKVHVINNHILDRTGLKAINMLFIDDDMGNCREVKHHFPECQCVRATNGIQANEVSLILTWSDAECVGGVIFHEDISSTCARGNGSFALPDSEINRESHTSNHAGHTFCPKKPGKGPLSRRCLHCGEHQDVHDTT